MEFSRCAVCWRNASPLSERIGTLLGQSIFFKFTRINRTMSFFSLLPEVLVFFTSRFRKFELSFSISSDLLLESSLLLIAQDCFQCCGINGLCKLDKMWCCLATMVGDNVRFRVAWNTSMGRDPLRGSLRIGCTRGCEDFVKWL